MSVPNRTSAPRTISLLTDFDAALEESAAALRRAGAVILTPTETVYGLVCNAADAAARDRIYRLKRRDAAKPLTLFTDDWRRLGGLRMEGLPAALAERFCPGPITIVAAKTDGGTEGFRIPDHPFMLKLLRILGFPLASTSANLSGGINATTAAEAAAQLCGDPDLIVDGGAVAPGALASTVVDATGAVPRILRQGVLIIPGAAR